MHIYVLFSHTHYSNSSIGGNSFPSNSGDILMISCLARLRRLTSDVVIATLLLHSYCGSNHGTLPYSGNVEAAELGCRHLVMAGFLSKGNVPVTIRFVKQCE